MGLEVLYGRDLLVFTRFGLVEFTHISNYTEPKHFDAATYPPPIISTIRIPQKVAA